MKNVTEKEVLESAQKFVIECSEHNKIVHTQPNEVSQLLLKLSLRKRLDTQFHGTWNYF